MGTQRISECMGMLKDALPRWRLFLQHDDQDLALRLLLVVAVGRIHLHQLLPDLFTLFAGCHSGALFRGGSFTDVAFAGVFAVNGNVLPTDGLSSVGFRRGR